MRRALGLVVALLVSGAAVAAVDGAITGPEWQALTYSAQTEFVQQTLTEIQRRWKVRAGSNDPITLSLAKAHNDCFKAEQFDAAWVEQTRLSIARYYEAPRNSCHQAFGEVDSAIAASCEAYLVASSKETGMPWFPIGAAPCPRS